MIHDFVVTETKLVISMPPLWADQTGSHLSFLGQYSWHGDQGVRTLIFDKNDLSLVREMALDPFWVFHFGNGYDSAADEITLDLTLHDSPNFMLDDAYAMMDGSWDGHVSAALTYGQIRLNLSSRSSQIETFPGFGQAEFLRIDPRAALGNHRHTLMLTERPDAGGDGAPGFGNLVLYDRQSDRAQTYAAADTEIMEEHVIVPHPQNPDQFWVLGSSQDWAEQATYFSIYEGSALANGPIYRARMEGILPLGLHGTFISAA